MMVYIDFFRIIEDELKCFCSIESIDVVDKKFGCVDINLQVDELKYIADVLSVGKIDKFLAEKLQNHIPTGVTLNINVNINMISSIDSIEVVMKL